MANSPPSPPSDDKRSCVNCGCALSPSSRLNVCPACGIAAMMPKGEPAAECDVGTDLPEIPGFEILELAGTGGMGRVYKARQIKAGRRLVAIKVLRSEFLSERAEKRFTREVAILSTLKHPHLAVVYDSGRIGKKIPYMVMEWIEGEALDISWRNCQADIRTITSEMAEICDAVQEVHARKIIHRDLHPGNVLRSSDGSILKVLDFGLARDTDETNPVSLSGMVVGSIGFISLEQGMGKKVDERTDVFSLGVILYLGLTGEMPFRSDSQYENLRAQENGERASFPQNGIPRELKAICLMALDTNAAHRYANAGDMAKDLRRFLAGVRVLASKDDAIFYSINKFASRHKAGVAVAIIFCFTLAGFLGWHLWSREVAARDLRAQLVETLMVAAELAGQRGQWSEALSLLTQAEQAGASDFQRIIFAKVEALTAAGRRSEAEIELEKLPKTESRTATLALANYWRAQLLTGVGNIPQATELLRKAASTGLPPAEKCIADAILEQDPFQALRLLEEAVVKFPMRHEALMLCSVAQLFAGRNQEARQNLEAAVRLFPQNTDIAKLHWLVAASTGESKLGADASMDGLLDILQISSSAYDIISGRKKPGLALVKYSALIAQDFDKVTSLALKFSFAMKRREVMGLLASLSPFTNRDTSRKELDAEVESNHPSPVLLLIWSVRLAEGLGLDANDLKRLEQACQLCRSIASPGSDYSVVLMELTAAVLFSHAVEANDAAASERAILLARQRLEASPISPAAGRAQVIGSCCVVFKQYALGKIYTQAALKERPDNTELIWNLAKIEFSENEWLHCLRLLARLKDPGHRNVSELRDAAQKLLLQYLTAGP